MKMPERGDSCWSGAQVRLRPVALSDAELWFKESGDEEGYRSLSYGLRLPRSWEEAQAWARKWADFGAKDERVFFSIESFAGEYVGNINAHAIDQRNGTFKTATRIFRAYRGRGLSWDARRILLAYGFNELRMQKFNASCLETNLPSICSLRRSGCTEEGRIRRSVFTSGQYYDELLFGLTREEFEESISDC